MSLGDAEAKTMNGAENRAGKYGGDPSRHYQESSAWMCAGAEPGNHFRDVAMDDEQREIGDTGSVKQG